MKESKLAHPIEEGGADEKRFLQPPGLELILRSILFNGVFYAEMIILMIIGAPALLLGRRACLALGKFWATSSLWLLEKICGLTVEYRGLENIPEGAIIVAAKHQSFLESLALTKQLNDFSFVLKRQLTWIPLFGWYILRAQQVTVDRNARVAALKQIVTAAKQTKALNRKLIIYPEGTRRKVGAPPAYMAGVAQICKLSETSCLPVGVNTGLFWPRRSFLRYPGTALVEFSAPLSMQGPRQNAMKTLQTEIETVSARLADEALEKQF